MSRSTAAIRTGAQRGFADRLAKEIDERGTVDVLRHGVVDHGRDDPAGVLPAGARPDARAGRAVRREPADGDPAASVRGGSTKTLDLCLFVNGIPVATAELKNPLTGQSVEHAIDAVPQRPRPRRTALARRRALVHFAVDPERVAMTTRLGGQGDAVPAVQPGPRPRRRGQPAEPRRAPHRATCGSGCGSATPGSTCSPGSCTSSRPPKGSKARGDGDLPAVPPVGRRASRSTAAARANGAGHDYLVQHSAGSGKSNTIAWLAHRLSTLHDDADAQGVRQGRRDHRPARARPAAAGHDLPVRARPRRGREDRQELASSSPRRWRASRPGSSSPRCRSSRSSLDEDRRAFPTGATR